MNKENLIQGNTVLSPKSQPFEPSHKDAQRKIEKRKKQIEKNKIDKRMHSKAKIIFHIVAAFCIGMALVYRYTALYNMQRDISKIERNIKAVDAENENLRIELIKYNNINYLEENSLKKLNMTYPSKNSIAYCDLAKDNFTHDTNKNNNSIPKKVFEKVKSILFLY